MGMGTWGLIGGIGKGIAEGGEIMAKYQAMQTELEEKRKARIEEIRTEYAERERMEVGKEERVEQRLQSAAKKFEPMFGVDQTPKTQADFKKPLIGNPDEYAVDPEGAAQGDDTEAFGKYQSRQAEGRSMADMAARRPEAIDDIQKAKQMSFVADALRNAIESKDWKEVARIERSLSGKGSTRVTGSGQVYDEIDGVDSVYNTSLTESIEDRNEAAAGRSRSGTTNDRAGEVAKIAASKVDMYEKRLESISKEKPPFGNRPEVDIAGSQKDWDNKYAEWEAGRQSRQRAIAEKLERAVTEYERAYGDLSERRGVGSGAGGGRQKPAGNRPPLPKIAR